MGPARLRQGDVRLTARVDEDAQEFPPDYGAGEPAYDGGA
jgi:hypothetical protein